MKVFVYEPSVLNYPNFITTSSSYYYFGAGKSYDYSRVVFVKPETAKIPEYEILSALSKSLPDWTYMYIAPKQVSNKSGDMMNFPFILREGNTELFLSPK